MGESRRKVEDFADVAERILLTISNVFKRDPQIDEFDLVPVESQSNRSPVIHVEHKLALESWCVPFLYSHSFKCFLQLITNGYSRRSPSQSHSPEPVSTPGKVFHRNGSNWDMCFKNGRYSPQSEMTENEKTSRKLNLSRVLLLLCPELVVAWNFRRTCVQDGILTWKEELKLAGVVLTRKPKSSECFAYRRWLLSNYVSSAPNADLFGLCLEEIRVSNQAANSYFSNYHAWSYRQWVISSFASLPSFDSEKQTQLLRDEKLSSDEWIEKHVSDHSGFHYREFVFKTAASIQDSPNRESMVTFDSMLEELRKNENLIRRFPGHQTLWYHRRFLILFTTQNILSNNCSEPMEMEQNVSEAIVMDVNGGKQALAEGEDDLVNSVTMESTARIEEAVKTSKLNFISKESTELNLLYAHQHSKWLNLMLGWKINEHK